MWQFVLLLLPLQTEKKRAVGTENILLTFLSLQRKALVWMSGGFWCVSSASPVYHKIATKFHTTAQKDKITWWHFISERSKVIHHDVSVWAWTDCKQQLGCLSCAAVISVILYFSLLFFFFACIFRSGGEYQQEKMFSKHSWPPLPNHDVKLNHNQTSLCSCFGHRSRALQRQHQGYDRQQPSSFFQPVLEILDPDRVHCE